MAAQHRLMHWCVASMEGIPNRCGHCRCASYITCAFSGCRRYCCHVEIISSLRALVPGHSILITAVRNQTANIAVSAKKWQVADGDSRGKAHVLPAVRPAQVIPVAETGAK